MFTTLANLRVTTPLADAPATLGWLRNWLRKSVRPAQDSRTLHRLAKGSFLNLQRPRGQRVECLKGCLWITLDYDSRDFIVEAGQSFTADRQQRALIHALAASHLRVTPAAE